VEVIGQPHDPAVLPQESVPRSHCIGSWVSPRTGLDTMVKKIPAPAGDRTQIEPVHLSGIFPSRSSSSNWTFP